MERVSWSLGKAVFFLKANEFKKLRLIINHSLIHSTYTFQRFLYKYLRIKFLVKYTVLSNAGVEWSGEDERVKVNLTLKARKSERHDKIQ